MHPVRLGGDNAAARCVSTWGKTSYGLREVEGTCGALVALISTRCLIPSHRVSQLRKHDQMKMDGFDTNVKSIVRGIRK